MSATAAGTVAALLITALTGVFALIFGLRAKRRQDDLDRRTSDAEDKLKETEKAVDLERAEREGWVELIKQLREQVRLGSDEVRSLRERLALGTARFEALEERFQATRAEQVEAQAQARERIAALRAELAYEREAKVTLGMRIDTLRAEVTRLGGDVTKINRHGKTGAQGPPGEQGPPGDHG